MAPQHFPLGSPSMHERHWETHNDESPSRPPSAPGTSRQTRRLQLRNAGFRGAALPTRKVTPKSTSTSASGLAVSDAENVSPSGRGVESIAVGKRRSSGILQEIGNSSMTRPKKTRPRLASAKLFAVEDAGASAFGPDELQSPPPPQTAIRPRGVKARAKMSHKRRSVSAEMAKYIDHLEVELASAQSHLSAITSPTVTREQSCKVRNLNAETKQLQQELDEWEGKYERRVQEALDEHVAIENGLRNRIRSMEEEVEEARFRLQELEMQLESTTKGMTASETANINLERRLEIMSELLAASPTKIDLHAGTAGRKKKQQRPQSMLPRFPTASSLMGSPERQSITQPTSPMLSFANHSPVIPFSPAHAALKLAHSPQPSDAETTDAESVFSDAPGTADSITSVETAEPPGPFNPWCLPPVREHRSRPARRMRRFGAGSMGPRPLILPSTAHCEPHPPSSAPPLERSEMTPAFFPHTLSVENGDHDLSLGARRRASTTAGEIELSSFEAPSPLLDEQQQQMGCEGSTFSVITPHADQFNGTSRDFSSIGSNMGRNLMEELSTIPTNESGSSVEGDKDAGSDGELGLLDEARPTPDLDEGAPDPPRHSATDATEPESSADTILIPPHAPTHRPTHSGSRSRSATQALHPTASIFDRLRLLFADLWRSPVALARHLVRAAQARVRLPSPLLHVQWWLVGVLLGPMARRRMLPHPPSHECRPAGPAPLLDGPHCDTADVDDHRPLACGPLQPIPPSTPHPPSRNAGSIGPGGNGAVIRARCAHPLHHHHRRRKHSPLLWLQFSLTLAFAVGAAFKDGPGSLLRGGGGGGCGCGCWVPPVSATRVGRGEVAD